MKISIILAAMTGSFETDMNRAAKTAKSRMSDIEKNAKMAGKAIGAALIAGAGAAAKIISDSITAADELGKMAQKAGVTTESMSSLAYAADLSGVANEKLVSSLVKLTKNASDAAQGLGESKKGFDALGISVTNADGTLKDSDALLKEVAGQLAKYEDGAAKTALAVNIFGKAGADLIPLLNSGAAGIEEMQSQASELGVTLDSETSKSAERFNDNLTRLKSVGSGLANRVMKELLPSLEAMSERMFDSAKKSGALDTAARIAATGIRVLVSSGVILSGVFKTIGDLLGGIGASLVAFAQGEFQLAANITAETLSDVKNNVTGTIDALSDVWDDVGDKAEADAAEISEKLAAPMIMAEEKIKNAKASADKAIKEAEKDFAAAQSKLSGFIEARAPGADSPRSVAEKQRRDDLAELLALEGEFIRLGKLGEKQANDLAVARDGVNETYRRTLEEIEATATPLELLLEDMQFELDLIGKTNAQRVAEIELRRLGVSLSAEEKAAAQSRIESLVKEAEAQMDVIAAMDEFRSNLSGNIADVLTGAKSIKDAFEDMANAIIQQIARMIAQQWVAKMFGEQGSSGGGSAGGDALASLFGSFFGGGRANGGPVSAGVPYLVGERGPEMIIPQTNGTVMTNQQTRAMLGRRESVVNQVINVTGTVDRRTSLQIAEAASQRQRLALRNA